MAILKSEVEDALSITGELMVPLLILKTGNKDIVSYAGLVPGLLMKNVISPTPEKCLEDLKQYIKIRFKTMLDKEEPFPFFPSKEEIEKDYDNIISLTFIKIKSNKRKA